MFQLQLFNQCPVLPNLLPRTISSSPSLLNRPDLLSISNNNNDNIRNNTFSDSNTNKDINMICYTSDDEHHSSFSQINNTKLSPPDNDLIIFDTGTTNTVYTGSLINLLTDVNQLPVKSI